MIFGQMTDLLNEALSRIDPGQVLFFLLSNMKVLSKEFENCVLEMLRLLKKFLEDNRCYLLNVYQCMLTLKFPKIFSFILQKC